MTTASTAALVQADQAHRLPYLPALDGLRGVAVAVVVAFHAHWLTGGYLGVDLFFVLSGFLITRLLLNEYADSARIDLAKFWKRRARRLLPALILVTLFAAVVERARGTLDGPTGGRRDVIGALTYSSNWLRMSAEAGYWRQFARPALLDHIWSLAIEEQFYVVWPLLVFGLLRFVRSDLGRVLILGIASCGLGLWALRVFSVTSDANRIYMGTDTRAVALLLGATVAAIAHRRSVISHGSVPSNSAVLRVAAVPALLVLALMIVRMRGDALITYEGGLLLCSLAGAIVVAAGALERPPAVFRIFTAAPLRWLGLRSYGIYLWHWPIMVGLRVASRPTSASWRRLAAVVITLVVAEISYRFIEQPIRRKGLLALRRPARTVALGLGIASLSLAVVFIPTKAVSMVTAVPLPTSGPAPAAPSFPVRALPDEGLPKVMFVGDSVGFYLGRQANAERERLGIKVVNEAHNGCPLSDTPLRRRGAKSSVPLVFAPECQEAVRAYGDTVADAQPDVVIMVFGASFLDENEISPGEWHAPCTAEFDGWFQDQITRSVEALSSTGATVYWATTPYYRGEVDDKTPTFDDQVDCENEVARTVAAQSNGVLGVLELGQWTCPTRDCLTERDGYELRFDGFHYIDEGAALANIWMLQQIFDPLPWMRAVASS
ncbi:MAG: acyltransferase [Actinomycetia bacterium]|nr:acyltransferase [Actinomycetes bacterium]